MAMVGESHVIPSGRVYRQIFDAEVQLVRSLKEARNRAAHHVFPLESVRIPLVRDVETRTGALLSPRQQLWIESMPNDCFTENPVYYREYMTDIIKKTQETESEIAAREVRGLTDVIVPETTDGSFLQHITENRRERHEAALAALHQKLVYIRKELETLVMNTGKSFQTKLIESNRNIELQFQKIESERDKACFTLQDFKDLWIIIAQNSQFRRQCIKEMDETLTSQEGNRVKQIGDVLKEYIKILEKISYLMPQDVYRLIHKEAMMLNQAVLANHRAITKLSMNLVEADLKREASQWLQWQDIVKSWKTTQKDLIIQKFRDFIENEEIQNPEGVKMALDLMIKKQGELHKKRLEHLQSVREMIPPKCTKAKVAELNATLVDLNKKIDNLGVQCLDDIRIQFVALCQQCMSEIQNCRKQLVEMKIYCLEESQTFVITYLFPIVGKLQRKFEEELELIDRALKKLTRHTEDNCKDLFNYSREAANLWDVLETGLLQQEKELQKKLEECRQQYDSENHVKEALLDIMLDKLRQESFQQELDNNMQKTLQILEDSQNGYKTFHKRQVEIVETYPASVRHELISYSSSVSQYFGVKEVYGQEQTEEDLTSVPYSNISVEVFTTSKRSTYSLISSQELAGPPKEELFITEVTVEEDLPEYLQQIVIPENIFADIKKDIRLGFFEHLKPWFDQTVIDSQSIVVSKTDELTAELKLFCHLQEPRAQRIQKDVYHVRAAELLLHQQRVESHSAGVKESLKRMKSDFNLVKNKIKNESKNFEQTISNMEPIFMNATRSDKLVSLCSSLYPRLEGHMETVQIAIRSYRQHLENTLGLVRDANADCIKSFRLFSDGGNFSPEEFGILRSKLLKAAKDIDSAERSVMADLEKMESKCLEKGTDVIYKFEEKFQILKTDMIFMENIQKQLTKLQVKIKGEVATSNLQTQKLQDSLEQFSKKIDACARPNIEKEAITAEELYNFAKSMMKDMRKRSKYLHCLLESYDVSTEILLQGPIAAAAARSETFRQEHKVTFLSTASLLQPCETGKSVLEDAAVRMIKNILESQHPQEEDKEPAVSHEVVEPDLQQLFPGLPPRPPGQPTDGIRSSAATGTKKSTPPLQSHKSEVILPKLPSIRHFRGKISHILWDSYSLLLAMAEEFYSKKEKRNVIRLEYLKETCEQCVNTFLQKLMTYQKQTEEYYSSCLLEFREQLEQFENLIVLVLPMLIDNLLKEHLNRLHSSSNEIQLHLKQQLQIWEHAKAENEKMLRPTLGHPDNLKQLQELCKQEENRQQEHTNGIILKTQNLQKLFATCAEDFVSALSSLTEKLLLELDESICVDDIVTVAQAIEMFKGKMTKKKLKLLRQKQAEPPLVDQKLQPITGRGSRNWPGLPRTGLIEAAYEEDDIPEETATVTTAKSTLGHITAVEARDAAYTTYKQHLAMEIEKTEEEGKSQLIEVNRWKNWWRKSVLQIKKLYA
uniref:Coiled-coil domain-containing protein 180 n=1 Tax=Geotrypetes seraphini TaxID=260995 RepID=A0A6P8SGB1_GEOSA|nr:coiled-coil domain-containing protein 180 [Geotrypetes seraphini]XP_033817555.1 coiled-coil domain-containing protein 180 [Geotrypetes seraphini]